jgi:hypothetical protein
VLICSDNISSFSIYSEVASLGLLSFDGFEKSFEVSSTETIVVTSLDDLHEEGRSVFKRQGEEL